MGERTTYRFGPLERRSLLGPVRGGQALLVGAAVLFGVVILDTDPSVGALFGALLLIAAAIGASTLPVGRRTLDEWAPVVASFITRRLGGGWRFRSPAPASGGVPAPPPAVGPVKIGQLEYRDREIGVLSERHGRRLTAVLSCRVVAFALLDPEAQERRLARWGLVLSGTAGTPVRRVQWIERTVPPRGDELARWLHDERDPQLPPRGTPMIESYLELISGAGQVTQEHELLLAVQVDAARVRERGRDATERALIEAAERLAERLRAAEVQVTGALSPAQLGRALKTAFDPYARAELASLEAADAAHDGVAEAGAWPIGAEERWDGYRSDGAEHVTFWIGGWPRVDVSALFMDALLGRSSTVRAVAVTFEPLPTDRSTRDVEAAVTRDRADRELRRRFGQSETARQRQAQESTMRREAELAAGHAEVRMAGFITVSGRDPEDLRRACGEVQEHAARARLELHRMYGQQADAFTFTLPLCRGLK